MIMQDLQNNVSQLKPWGKTPQRTMKRIWIGIPPGMVMLDDVVLDAVCR